MLNSLRAVAAGALFALAAILPATAQNSFPTPGGATVPGYVTMCVSGNIATPCNPGGGGGGGLAAGAAVTGCPAQANLFVTSGLTLGCVAPVSENDSGSVLTLTGNLSLPDTGGAGLAGIILLGGARFIHDTGATSNVFVGHNSATLTTTMTNSTCVGESCMLAATSGNSNTCIGRFCMGAGGVGGSNTAVGTSAMSAVTSGSSNVGIGVGTNAVTTSSNTTCVGTGACAAATGAGTTAVGFNAGAAATGATNTFIGQSSGSAVVAGASNTFVGSTAGNAITTTSGNTYIGQGCTGAVGLANTVQLGSAACANKLDFGVTTASVWTFTGGTIAAPLTTDSTHTTATVCRDTTSGQFFFGSGAAGICVGTSSIRFKQNVADLQPGLAEIMALEPVSYRYKLGYGDPNHKLYGFTAEQMATVLPELVRSDADGRPSGIDWAGLVPVLVRAIQQQQAEIEDLKRRVH